jgi:hypothetical protein
MSTWRCTAASPAFSRAITSPHQPSAPSSACCGRHVRHSDRPYVAAAAGTTHQRSLFAGPWCCRPPAARPDVRPGHRRGLLARQPPPPATTVAAGASEAAAACADDTAAATTVAGWAYAAVTTARLATACSATPKLRLGQLLHPDTRSPIARLNLFMRPAAALLRRRYGYLQTLSPAEVLRTCTAHPAQTRAR